MTRSLRLTLRAEASLVEIAKWTIENFGLKQGELYETELLSRWQAILNGQAHGRNCSILVEDAEDMRFVRAGSISWCFWIAPRRSSSSTSCIPAAIFHVMPLR